MISRIDLGDIAVEVVQKDIKNIHLSVNPPGGRVRISAPVRMNLDAIRAFAVSRLAWIKQQQAKFQSQQRETRREYLNRESHYVWGRRYLLTVVEHDAAPMIELKHAEMLLRVRPGTGEAKRQALMDAWYRAQLKLAVGPLLAKWESLIGVGVDRVFVQKMKTKWGSCNPPSRNIRLNAELGKKSPECLEYILVHELVHLLVRHHDDAFISLMDRYLPNWRITRQKLNEAPLAHTTWSY
jgi:predicted metal-dependent hydrolase